MKKRFSFFLFVSLIGLISCNSIEQKRRERITADSLKLVEQLRLDSIDLAKAKELAKKAYADSKFGMSTKEVSDLPHFKDWNIVPNDSNSVYNYCDIIGDRCYNVSMSFDCDKLYSVEFASNEYRSANYIDTEIRYDIENLKEIITKTYGEPTGIVGMPSIIDINPRTPTVVYEWLIATKYIQICVKEKYSGSEFVMVAYMWDTELASAKKERMEKEEKEKKANDPVLF